MICLLITSCEAIKTRALALTMRHETINTSSSNSKQIERNNVTFYLLQCVNKKENQVVFVRWFCFFRSKSLFIYTSFVCQCRQCAPQYGSNSLQHLRSHPFIILKHSLLRSFTRNDGNAYDVRRRSQHTKPRRQCIEGYWKKLAAAVAAHFIAKSNLWLTFFSCIFWINIHSNVPGRPKF